MSSLSSRWRVLYCWSPRHNQRLVSRQTKLCFLLLSAEDAQTWAKQKLKICISLVISMQIRKGKFFYFTNWNSVYQSFASTAQKTRHFLLRWTEWRTWAWTSRETISTGFSNFSSCKFFRSSASLCLTKGYLQYLHIPPWPFLSECWDWQTFFCSCWDQYIIRCPSPQAWLLLPAAQKQAAPLWSDAAVNSRSSLWLRSETQHFPCTGP